MSTWLYPTDAEISAIAQDKIPNLIADRPIFQILPMRTTKNSMVIWEQQDNYRGLQQIRGYNGLPARVQPVGLKQYNMQPGVYGEFRPINEMELTTRRQPGTFNVPIDVSDLVMEAQDHLLGRRLDRIEQIGWTLISTGVFSVPSPTGAIVHTDTFPVQTYSAGVAWSTFATATPLADFSAVQLLSRGRSVNFGAVATAYMSRPTFNNLRSNINAADIYGRRTIGLGTINNLQGFNQLLMGDDLPQIVVYDGGYLNDAGTFVPWLATGTVVVVGKRPAGQTVGEYQFTKNAQNNNMAGGPYMKVVDTGDWTVPRNIEIHDGHNGGPALYYPSAIVVMSV